MTQTESLVLAAASARRDPPGIGTSPGGVRGAFREAPDHAVSRRAQ